MSQRFNPVYQRIGQAYLSFTGSMDRLVDEVEKSGKDPDKARFAARTCGGAT